MKTLTLVLASIALSSPLFADEGSQNLRLIESSPDFVQAVLARYPGVKQVNDNVMLVPIELVADLSRSSHELTGHCGGFIDVTSEPANQSHENLGDEQPSEPLPELGSRKEWITQLTEDVRSPNLHDFDILYTGQFKTRLASSEEGAAAPKWLQATWQKMAAAAGRDDIKVELYEGPDGYEQKSVRITIPGKQADASVVVLGAHLDSINHQGEDEAPGQDDDASGITALTEVYRILLAHNAHPVHTIQIFGYAAEELGLLGSRVIAQQYQAAGTKVRGVMQLDMIGYPSDTHAITFMTDYTDHDLTVWTEQLLNLYVGGDMLEDRCGYGCSDHASWNRYGYPAVMPFESPMRKMNHRLHTAQDVWDGVLDADFAARFTKLAVAFVAELSGQ